MADVYTVPTYSYCENTLEIQGPRGTTIDVTGLLDLPVPTALIWFLYSHYKS